MTLEYTHVKRDIRAVVVDGPDEDDLPDKLRAQGIVTFTPVIRKGDTFQYDGPDGLVTMVPKPIEARISDGIIFHRGREGVKLLAGGPDMNPNAVRWRARFEHMQAGGWSFTLRDVTFDAVPGGEVDLTLAAPVAGTPGEGIVRGPSGTSIQDVHVEGAELVITAIDDDGVRELNRIPLDDVVASTAEAAAESTAIILRGEMDAKVEQAGRSASGAATSEENAGNSATTASNHADTAGEHASTAGGHAQATASDREAVGTQRQHVDQQARHVDAQVEHIDGQVSHVDGQREHIDTARADAVEAAGRIGTAKQVEDWSKAAEQAAKKAETSSEGVQTVVDNAAAVVQQRVSDDADRAETAATRAEGAMDGKADLIGGVVPTSQIPAVALTKPFPVATIEDMLDLDVQEGDIAIVQQGEGKGSYILGDGPVSELSSWHALEVATDTVTSINGQTGTVVLQAHDVGAAPVEHEHRWSEIRDKPSSYTPASHSHPWSEVTGKPSAFPPDNHRHPADQIDGLEALIRERVMAILREVPFLVMWDGEGEWVPGEWASIRQGVLNIDSSEIHSVVEKGEA